jgi:chromatin segregation and condensation protein Rec8/ScpA/Scc1 (kleisin family)
MISIGKSSNVLERTEVNTEASVSERQQYNARVNSDFAGNSISNDLMRNYAEKGLLFEESLREEEVRDSYQYEAEDIDVTPSPTTMQFTLENDDYEEDEQDPRDELIQRLLEYQKYKIASAVLEDCSDENLYIPRKGAGTSLFPIEKREKELEALSVLDLMSAFAEVLKKKAAMPRKNSYEIEKLECTVEEKIVFLRSVLVDRRDCRFFEFVNENMSNVEIACCFLAILELVKQGEAVIQQNALFGDIFVVKKDKPEELGGS